MQRFYSSNPYRVFCAVVRAAVARGRLGGVAGFGSAVSFVLRLGRSTLGIPLTASVAERPGGSLVTVEPADDDIHSIRAERRAVSDFMDEVEDQLRDAPGDLGEDVGTRAG